MSTTLLNLRTMVRQRADMENSTFVSDPEVTSYINQSYFVLYDLLVQKFGNDYYVAPFLTITTDGINDQFARPDGTLYSGAPALYKLLGLDLFLAANSWVTLKPFNTSERNRYSIPNFQSFYGVTNMRYRLNGGKLWLTPLPAGGQQLRLLYIPRMTPLALDTDLLDGVSGWDEYVVIDAAIKCLQKEESDVSVLSGQKGAMIARIEAAASNRDVGNPMTVSDTQSGNCDFPTGMGGY